jgi:hypothetical protein
MDETKFNSLMVKLQAASWTLYNAISNTKMFSTKINEQKIKLYNVENGPIYINSQRLDLTDAQIETMLSFVDQLIENSASEIQDANEAKRQSLVTALNRILE